jgi:hypothetical protein
MQSTLNLTQTDPHADPHDHVLVARVAEDFSGLAVGAVGRPSDSPAQAGSDFTAGPSVASLDTTFRAAAVSDGKARSDQPSTGARAVRAVVGFLLAVCIGAAAFAWQSYGDAAKQVAAKWMPQLGVTSSPPLENAGLSEPTNPSAAVPASAAKTAAAPAVDPAQPAGSVASNAAVPPPEAAQSLQSMAADLANAGQEIAQLKATIEQLKAGQGQMSRDLAKLSEAQASVARVSDTKTSDAKSSETRASETRASDIKPAEPSLRPKISPPPRRVAAVPARRPMQPYYPAYPSPAAYPAPQPVAAPPPLPQAVTAPVPQRPEPPPLATAQPDGEPVLRPPMPVR